TPRSAEVAIVAERGDARDHAPTATLAAGAIVYLAARPGIDPSPAWRACGVSRAAVVYLTRIGDIEPRTHGIRVDATAPQRLDTPPIGPPSRPQDPAYMQGRPDRGQFPDVLRLPVERHADATQ